MGNSPRYDTDALLAELGWIRSLARRLVGQDADDLVQDTWAQAAPRLPKRDRPLRPWLAAVTRRLASNRHRSNRHRQDRETAQAANAASESPSSSELVQRGEAQRNVVDAVLSLSDPYRSVLLLRYFEGLPTADIAQRLGRSDSTVRTQLTRGVEQLRARLDASTGGDRARWMSALTPLAGWHVDLPSTAAASFQSAASHAARTPWTYFPSLALMPLSLKFAFAAVPLVLVTLWFRSDTPPPQLDVRTAAQAPNEEEPVLPPALAEVKSSNDAEPIDGARTSALASAVPEGASADGPWSLLVTDRATGAPVPYWHVREGTSRGVDREPMLGGDDYRTDGAGRIEFESPVAGVVPVRSFEASRRMHAAFRPNSSPVVPELIPIAWVDGEATLAVDVGLTLTVDLGLPSGVKESDVLFLLNDLQTPDTWTGRPALLERGASGAFVRFRSRKPEPKQNVWLHAVTLDGRFGANVKIDDALATDRHVGVQLEPRCVVTIDLRGDDETPFAAIDAFLLRGQRELDGVDFPYLERVQSLAAIQLQPDGRARVRFDALRPGEYTLTVVPRGFDKATLALTVEPGTIERELTLKPRAMEGKLTGRVTSKTGQFHSRLYVAAAALSPDVGADQFQGDVTWTESDGVWTGSFCFEKVSKTQHQVALLGYGEFGEPTELAGYLDRQFYVAEPGETLEIELDDAFTPQTIKVQAVDDTSGEPVSGIHVFLSEPNSRSVWHNQAMDATAVLTGVRWTDGLNLLVSGDEYFRLSQSLGALPKDGLVTVRLKRGWTCDVFVTDVDGKPLAGVEVLMDGVRQGTTKENGSIVVELATAPGSVETLRAGWKVKKAVGVAEDGTLLGGYAQSGRVIQVLMQER